MYGSRRSLLRLFLVACALAAFSLAGRAGEVVNNYGPVAAPTQSGYTVSYSSQGAVANSSNRTYTNNSDGSVGVADAISVSTAVGPLALTVGRTIPWASVVQGGLAGARACMGNPLCVGSAAVIAGVAAYRCKLEAWKWMCDSGAPPSDQVVGVWVELGKSSIKGDTPGAACSAARAAYGWPGYVLQKVTDESYSCGVRLSDGTVGNAIVSIIFVSQIAKKCPLYMDPVTLQMTEGATGADGKCPTGLSQETTDAILASRILAASAAEQDRLRPDFQGAVPGVVGSGVPSYESNGTVNILPGWTFGTGKPTSTTTTDSAGNTTTKTNTPTATVDVNGRAVNITNNNNAATIINGVPTSTTTTTRPAGGTAAPVDVPDLCALHPDSSACAQLGTPDGGEDIIPPIPVLAEIVQEVFTSQPACPAPVQFTIPRAGTYSISWGPLCAIAQDVLKPLIQLLGFMAAASIFSASFRIN